MIFGISVVELDDVDELKTLTTVLDKKIVVADPREGCPYYECNLEKDIALIIGNEAMVSVTRLWNVPTSG